MPWRRLSMAQVIVLAPIVIKCLAWLMVLVASLTKLMGHPELATALMAIASALGVADAKHDLNQIKSNE